MRSLRAVALFRAIVATLAVAAGMAALGQEAPEITGRVFDANGQAVPKIAVELTALPSPYEARAQELEPELARAPVQKTSTDSAGRFRLTAPHAGMFRVRVHVSAVVYEAALLPVFTDVDLPALRLTTEEMLRVRVTDHSGQPRAGARVRAGAIEERRTSSDAWKLAERMARADENGIALIPKLRGERLRISAIAEEAPETEAVTAATTVELRLDRGCARTVSVSNRNRTPARALVAGERWALGTTDVDGRLSVALPCKNEVRLFACIEDGCASTMTVPAAMQDDTAPITLVLEPEDRIAGRVLDAASRQPLAHALVWRTGDPAVYAYADARGQYTLPRSAEIHAVAAGHLPRSEKPAPSGAAAPTFALQPTATLSGTVSRSEGPGIADAEIRVEEWSSDAVIRFQPRVEGLRSRVVTRANGTFRVEVLPGRAHTLIANGSGLAPARLTVAEKLAAGAIRTGLQIIMNAGRTAFGKAIDEETRQPVAGAEVRLMRAAATAKLPNFLRRAGDEGTAWERIQAKANDDGVFRLEHVPEGRFDLITAADGFAVTNVEGIVIDGAHSEIDLGDVALGRSVALDGSVVDENGRGIDKASVFALPPSAAGIGGDAAARIAEESGEARKTSTAENGGFSIDGLARGAILDVIAEAFGDDTFAEVDSSVLTLEDTLSTISAQVTIAVG